MRFEELICPSCGGKLKQGEKNYFCAFCGAEFVADYMTEQTEALSRLLDTENGKRLAHARRNRYEATREPNISRERLLTSAREVLKLDPDDFLSRFYEAICDTDPRTLNVFLDGLSDEEMRKERALLSEVAEFTIGSLEKRNVGSLKNFVDRAHRLQLFSRDELTNYNTCIEDAAQKLDEGFYAVNTPWHVFVAYSSKDMAEVNDLVDMLTKEKLRCFTALSNLRHGVGSKEKYQQLLETAMHNSKAVVFVSTENSRDLDCDALSVELPYLIEHEPQIYRIEYRPPTDSGKTPMGAQLILKKFFHGLEYCGTKEDVLARLIQNIILKDNSAKKPKEGSQDFTEERKRLEDEQQKLEAERKQIEEERQKLEAAQKLAAQQKQLEDERQALEAQRKQLEEEQRALEAQRKQREENAREEQRRQEEAAKAEEERKRQEEERQRYLAQFEIEDGVLKKYQGEDKEVIIPDGVTSIGMLAFSDCTELTSIMIPNSVEVIEGCAFMNCSGLTSIMIPDSVTFIGLCAFSGCSGLTSVTIGNGVESIGVRAFYGCIGLTSITIGNGVRSIGDSAFFECADLTSITMPNSVTSIGNSAFYGCSRLTSVKIGNGVRSIGDSAFFECADLTSITIPNSVTSIGDNAFYGCSGLTSLTIPNGVTSIGDNAFYGCSGLTSAIISGSVKSIGDGAFHGCSGLTSLTIGNGVETIGEWAFYFCTELTAIKIPDSVESIGQGAFYDCIGLTSVEMAYRTVTDLEKIFSSSFDRIAKIEFNFTY